MLIPNIEPSAADAEIIIDATHLGKRHITGIERITLELFSQYAMQPLKTRSVDTKNRLHMMWQQNITLPIMALKNRNALFIIPGFPPSILMTFFGARVVPYIHDLFLITRWSDLGFVGKFYMSIPFRFAVRNLPMFLVNSETTGFELRKFCKQDAEIILYRPPVRNVFSVSDKARNVKQNMCGTLKLIALGTVEPRKNLCAAANILAELRAGAYPNATLDIIGKIGWGGDAETLKTCEGITLHGYKSSSEIKELIENSDLLISTSHDEGLGLPLLEAQYSGICVVAPNKPVFREVLGESGVFIEPSEAQKSAKIITDLVVTPKWRAKQSELSQQNILRWNALAASDHIKVIALLGSLANRQSC